jgi:hypothetical protein
MSNLLNVVVASLTIVAASTSVGIAQERPNFSGEWILNLGRSTLHPDLANLKEGIVRIVHREPQFAFESTYVIDGQPRKVSYETTTDGVEKRTERPGVVTTSTMTWMANVLLLSQRISLPQGQTATNAVRYELVENGTVLRAVEDAKGPNVEHHNVWLFDRR